MEFEVATFMSVDVAIVISPTIIEVPEESLVQLKQESAEDSLVGGTSAQKESDNAKIAFFYRKKKAKCAAKKEV